MDHFLGCHTGAGGLGMSPHCSFNGKGMGGARPSVCFSASQLSASHEKLPFSPSKLCPLTLPREVVEKSVFVPIFPDPFQTPASPKAYLSPLLAPTGQPTLPFHSLSS